jgi:hypothetical protein
VDGTNKLILAANGLDSGISPISGILSSGMAGRIAARKNKLQKWRKRKNRGAYGEDHENEAEEGSSDGHARFIADMAV